VLELGVFGFGLDGEMDERQWGFIPTRAVDFMIEQGDKVMEMEGWGMFGRRPAR